MSILCETDHLGELHEAMMLILNYYTIKMPVVVTYMGL